MFSLKNKNIVLTGALGILGQHFARGLWRAGANLALVDLNQSELDHFCKELMSTGKAQKCIGYSVNLVKEEEVKSFVSQAVSDFGAINCLHNNAASKGKSLEEFLKPYEEYNINTWQEVMSINIDSMFLMTKYIGPQMVNQQNGGSIIQTSSIYGVVAPDQRIYEGSLYNGLPITSPGVYSASKAAVIGLTQYLASYWGKYQIRVNTLTPGGVESGQNEVFSKKYSDRIPLARMATPEDLVGGLIYLCSDESRYITGQNLIIDGGLTCW